MPDQRLSPIAAGARLRCILALVAGLFLCGVAGEAQADPPAAELAPAAAAAAALREAQAAIALARDAGNLWLATPGRLAAARAAAARGDYAEAIRGARRAGHEAGLALNQAWLERARYLLGHTTGLDPQVRATVVELLAAHDGKAALRMLEQAGAGP